MPQTHSRFMQWRLGSPKRTHRSYQGSLSLLLLALLLFVLAMQPLISPRSKFLRSANDDSAQVTPQEMIANEIATGITPAERDMVLEPPTNNVPALRDTKIGEDTTAVQNVIANEQDGIREHYEDDILAENREPEDNHIHNENTEDDNEARQEFHGEEDTHDENDRPTDEDIQIPPVSSVLHPDTPEQLPLNADITFSIQTSTHPFAEYEEVFPQNGKREPGQHYRIENTRMLTQLGNRESSSVLLICIFNDAESWGNNRNMQDFFTLVESFEYPKEKISIALLTSSADEFVKAKQLFSRYIQQYPRLSVIFRNDFTQSGLNRINRHADSLQGGRRRMLARYRNFALLSSLETWHQHVLWLDADINVIPPDLLLKMVRSGRDIVEPMCLRKYTEESDDNYEFDLNAWVGQRKVRPVDDRDGDFVPGPLRVKNLHELRDEPTDFVPLDSVGGTMLYVRADVHRQGVVFPAHYIIGSEWSHEGYDGIETEGLCYSAHFVGFKCWGLPNDIIFHAT